MLLFQRKFRRQAFPATLELGLRSKVQGLPAIVPARRDRDRDEVYPPWRAGPHGLPFFPRSALFRRSPISDFLCALCDLCVEAFAVSPFIPQSEILPAVARLGGRRRAAIRNGPPPVTQSPRYRPSTTVSLSNARFSPPNSAVLCALGVVWPCAVCRSPILLLRSLRSLRLNPVRTRRYALRSRRTGTQGGPRSTQRLSTGSRVEGPRCRGCFFVRCEIFPPKTTYVRPREVMHIKVCT